MNKALTALLLTIGIDYSVYMLFAFMERNFHPFEWHTWQYVVCLLLLGFQALVFIFGQFSEDEE